MWLHVVLGIGSVVWGVMRVEAGPIIAIPGIGKVEGVVEGNVATFYSIPYAAPPVGDFRWRAPQSATPWNGVMDTTKPKPACAQPGDDDSVEDCLFLDVHMPLNASSKSLPVYLWVHGGGFTVGSSINPNGTYNVQRSMGSVVLVSINYRLGAFGYLGGRALANRSSDGAFGNYGSLDQRFAMKWVVENIAAFGGDGSQVFLVGESAGAHGVSVHLSMPKSWKYFSSAGMESGGFSDWSAQSADAADSTMSLLLEATKCSTIMCLESLSTAEIIDGMNSITPPIVPAGLTWCPVVDGVELPMYPFDAARHGKVSPVPILIGSNADEGTSFTFGKIPKNLSDADYPSILSSLFPHLDPSNITTLTTLYPLSHYNTTPCCTRAFWAASRAQGDYIMSCPSRIAALQWPHQANVFLYVFTHRPFYQSDPSGHEFCPHAAEIPYVFYETPHLDGPVGYATANVMSNFWINFATSSNPNNGPLPPDFHWPTFSSSQDQTPLLNASSTIATAYKSQACNFWALHRNPK